MLVRDANWNTSADIVVVGLGGAGAVAAITAADAGADVLIVEKQPGASHCTNTHMAGGAFLCPNDKTRAVRYMEGLYRVTDDLHWTDHSVLHAWAEYCADNKRWIESLGGNVKLFWSGAEHRQIPDWESIEAYRFAGLGVGLMRFLGGQLAKRNVRVLFNASANKLLTSVNGHVMGVRLEVTEDGAKRTLNVKAHRAVIMALGGFEFNEWLKLNYLRVYPTYFYGSPANTGDGIAMVQDVGASLWHMNCCSARAVAKFPDFPVAFTMDFGGKGWLTRSSWPLRETSSSSAAAKTCGFILVDRDGKRFTRENFKRHTLYYELTVYDSQRLLFPRAPCYWIFDQARIDGGPLPMDHAGPSGLARLYQWSKNNAVELQKGWIVQADSIVELARKLDVPQDNLERTVRQYNGFCARGDDPEFHRIPSDLIPISSPPFYAVTLYPGGSNTQGGPRRNHRAQVLNPDGDAIPHLYAAGEFGSVYGMLYPGAGNIAECIAFGRIAAENACREEPLA